MSEQITETLAKEVYGKIQEQVNMLQEYDCKVRLGQLYYADNRIYTRVSVYTEQDCEELIAVINELFDDYNKENHFSMNPLTQSIVNGEYSVNVCLYSTNDSGRRISSDEKLKLVA